MNPEEVRRATGKDPDNPTIIWRSRMHVLGAAIVQGLEAKYLNVWCDCSWAAPGVTLSSDVESFEDISDEVLAQAVQPWRDHLRLSGRMFRIHTAMTKAERKAERAAAEKVWPEGTTDHPGQLKGNDATARSEA